VTRFFIPLIDVLTLLFAMFLLLPLFKSEAGADDADRLARDDRLRQLEQELERLRRQGSATPKEVQEEIERLRQERIKDLQSRLVVRVFETDPATGRLYYYDPERAEVRNEADARNLIDRDRHERAGEGRELYYLILLPHPREDTGLPNKRQRDQYVKWFQGVALGFDAPGSSPGGGKRP
jgi:hypothetical protein